MLDGGRQETTAAVEERDDKGGWEATATMGC